MTISDKTRKLLWGRSGNRCAYCRRELVMAATILDDESIVGDECHIIARHPDWSRGDTSISEQELDDYPNLILLCKVHHKTVDDQPNTYTVDVLREMKRKHEKWVRETLQDANTGRKNPKNEIATRIVSGCSELEKLDTKSMFGTQLVSRRLAAVATGPRTPPA